MRPTPSILLMLCLGAAACGTVGFEGKPEVDSASEGLTEDNDAPVQITALLPGEGSMAGGDVIEVRGVGFEGEVSLLFAGTAAEITVDSPELLYARVPPAVAAVLVDVVLVSDLGEAVLPDGFQYVDDGGSGDGGDGGDGDDGGADGGDGSDGGSGIDGLTVGHATLDYFVIGCPSCFGVSSNLLIGASTTFHEPASVDWLDWHPALGTCVANADRSGPSVRALDLGSTAWLHGPADIITMPRTSVDGRTTYENTAVSPDAYTAATSFDVEDADGTFTTAPLRTVDQGFDSISPWGIFNDGTSAYTAMSASNMTLSWSPPSIAEAVIIRLDIFRDGAFVGDILCAAQDNGRFQVPQSMFGAYYSGDVAALYIYRSQSSFAEDPDDGSIFTGSSSFGGIGTVTLVP